MRFTRWTADCRRSRRRRRQADALAAAQGPPSSLRSPLISYPLRAARSLADRIVLVVGPNADDVVAAAGSDVRSVVQAERLGSGHAVLQARRECAEGTILVLPGDMPLLSVETIERLVAHHRKSRAAATVLTAVVTEPRVTGACSARADTSNASSRTATRATPRRRSPRSTRRCTASPPVASGRRWQGSLRQRPGRVLPDGRDRRAVARRGPRRRDRDVRSSEAVGVNDRKQLATVTAIQRRHPRSAHGGRRHHPRSGSTYIDDTVTIGADTMIYADVVWRGRRRWGPSIVVGAGNGVERQHDRRSRHRACRLLSGTSRHRGRRERLARSATCGPCRTWGRRPRSATSSS